MRIVGLAILAALSLAPISGCVGPQLVDPETAEYRREDARLRAIDAYETFSESCRRQGGVVYMTGTWGKLSPKVPDLTRIRCGAPLGIHGRPR